MALTWKIWFVKYTQSDGKTGQPATWELITHTNLDTRIQDLPILPVVLIANIRRDHNGIRFCLEMKRNYYCLVGGEWWASTLSGLLNYIDFNRPGVILRGGHIPNEIFEETYKLSKSDPEILKTVQDEFERDIEEASD